MDDSEEICGICGKGCFHHTDDEVESCLLKIMEIDFEHYKETMDLMK